MYKFIYYYILELRKKRNPDPTFDARAFVWITQVTHVFFIFAVLKKTFGINLPALSAIPYNNKLFALPFAILWLLFTNYYFKKHSDAIVKSYMDTKIVTVKNSVIVFSLLLIPLIIMIQLLKK